MPSVRATYRVQLSSEFDLDAVAGLIVYLDALGVSHVYTSPFLTARSGSPHGYDITDHNSINPELGGPEAFDRFHRELAQRGMGCILDFVPNHMGIGRADNPWWLDVLEWGRASPYADYFDIDWEPAKAELRGKVLLPFLGAPYGEELESGALRVKAEFSDGSLSVHYHEHRFPIGPRLYGRVLAPALTWLAEGQARRDLEALGEGFKRLPRGEARRSRDAVRARAAALKQDFAALTNARPDVRSAVDHAITTINGEPGKPRSFVALHRLLEAQAYRLAFWRVAADEINYRRFFDINELAGLRVERLELFDVMHHLVFRLIDEGKLDGLRIDHVDGLFDPLGYCERVARRLKPPESEKPAYFVVEKILARREPLPENWPVDGTTGYDFANQVLRLFVDPDGERSIDTLYRRFTRTDEDFAEILHTSKKHVLRHLLASELQVLANELDRIAEGTWRTRDFTLNTLRDALEEVVACFPVYRTYVTSNGAGSEDRAHIDWAVRQARRRSALPSRVFDFVSAVLKADFGRTSRRRTLRRRVVDFAMKAQQLTSPVAAKGEEDTAFYRYTRFVALNEVGGDPESFGLSVDEFHALNLDRAARWPRAMLATSTHDGKRGEDVRARLAALSEVPAEWRRAVLTWARLNRAARTELDHGPAPTRNDEYLLYQTLIGSWPLELADGERADPAILSDYRQRIRDYMVKAVREAKLRSSWAEPNENYELAVERFVDRLLDPRRSPAFWKSFVPFQQQVSYLGMINGLAQTLLRLTVPGVPDTYQGSELWDLNLVDPDNRRPVDFMRRAAMLRELKSRFPDSSDISAVESARALLSDWPDGRIKLFLIWRLLEIRRARPDLFDKGGYLPLRVSGARAGHLFAFARLSAGGEPGLIVLVPRLVGALTESGTALPVGRGVWGDTFLECPANFATGDFGNAFTGALVSTMQGDAGPVLPVTDVLADLPVAVLELT